MYTGLVGEIRGVYRRYDGSRVAGWGSKSLTLIFIDGTVNYRFDGIWKGCTSGRALTPVSGAIGVCDRMGRAVDSS